MKMRVLRHLFSALLSAMVIISCQGGGGMIADGGGVGGTGVIAVGAVHSLGSIVVNGSHFDTTEALVIVNGTEAGIGDAAVANNLDVGQIVIVEGRTNADDSGFIADRIRYDNRVAGPVEAIRRNGDDTIAELVVLAQSVRVNSITRFKTAVAGEIAQDDFVEISGFVDDTGAVWATFVENFGPALPGESVEITGRIQNLDPVAQTFEINDLLVDYSLADITAMPDGLLVDGLPVEVEGPLMPGSQLPATRIAPEEALGIDDAEQMEVTGFVTSVMSDTDFTIGRQAVQITPDALFVDGTPDQIFPGEKLEAGGSLVGGVLMAEEIEFWEPDQIEIEGAITAVLSVSEFAIGDQWVITEESTQYEDGQPQDIKLNSEIEVKGRLIDGVLVADKVSFENE